MTVKKATVFAPGITVELVDLAPVGLAAKWNFEEGSGVIAGDSSGNGNNGTLRNGAGWAVGKVGGAVALNGTNQDVQVADSPSLSIIGQGITLAAWIFPTAAANGTVIHKENQYSLRRNADGGMTYADSVTWSYATVGAHGTAPLNVWTHVAVTFDGAVIRFYVNGQPSGTFARTGSIVDNANQVYLGSYNGSLQFFAGKVDEAQIYSRALTAQEIAALAPPVSPAYVAPTFNFPTSLALTVGVAVALGQYVSSPLPLTWTAQDTTQIALTQAGMLTAKAEGSAQINVEVDDGYQP